VGNERPEQLNGDPLSFGVRCFRPADQDDKTRFKAISLNHFSETAIRELLRQMFVGCNPGKTIAFVPLDSAAGEHEAMTSEELYGLREHMEGEDIPEELNARAKRIKQSHTIVIIQKYQVENHHQPQTRTS
jgi:hypothetical protein